MKLGNIYFAMLGAVTLACGLADLIVTISREAFTLGVMEFPSEMFRGGWGGLIVLFAGLFYLSGARNISEIHQLSKVMMGSILIWLIAGCDIFARITESIPGGEEGWFNTMGGFLGTYAPPYTPAIILLPFSLVAIYYIHKASRGYV
ncbi:MAG: hypothetical protein ACXQT4_01255 [Methanotrichaceae archaeon]